MKMLVNDEIDGSGKSEECCAYCGKQVTGTKFCEFCGERHTNTLEGVYFFDGVKHLKII